MNGGECLLHIDTPAFSYEFDSTASTLTRSCIGAFILSSLPRRPPHCYSTEPASPYHAPYRAPNRLTDCPTSQPYRPTACPPRPPFRPTACPLHRPAYPDRLPALAARPPRYTRKWVWCRSPND